MTRTAASFAPLALASTVLLAAPACSSVRYTEAFSPSGDIEAVLLQVDQGTVEIEASDEVWVQRTIRAAEGTLDLSHDVVDGTLILRAICTTPIPCAVDTQLQLPAGIPVTVELGEGEVWASGMASLDLQLGEGVAEVDADDFLLVQLGQGELRASLASGSRAQLTVGSGDVEITLADADWDLQLSARQAELRGVEHTDGADSQLTAVVAGGRLLVQRSGQLAQR